MREIKFRAKLMDSDEWVYGGGVYTFKNGRTAMFGADRRGEAIVWRVKPETVGQYTGLKDKNGKEIYGGDIVNHGDNYPSEVVFDDYGWKLREWGYQNEGYKYRQHDFISYTSPIEVIGNIYENPELLKEVN